MTCTLLETYSPREVRIYPIPERAVLNIKNSISDSPLRKVVFSVCVCVFFQGTKLQEVSRPVDL